ncbi:hypothetical protein NDU88_003222 [Pleurodeles waltl]|uniref:Uncharacterized protein n=1 Tax=Pleurodeles waltl TaxID=8319 RepID=A0AAV7LGF8_PLEWA|nr:hypothetical protein NDU88_003222 [Pleurodeles waltl]
MPMTPTEHALPTLRPAVPLAGSTPLMRSAVQSAYIVIWWLGDQQRISRYGTAAAADWRSEQQTFLTLIETLSLRLFLQKDKAKEEEKFGDCERKNVKLAYQDLVERRRRRNEK